MRIYVIRHSVPSDEDYDEDDPELTKEGIAIVQSLGEWMLDKDEVPNALIASPTTRTQQTADILKDVLGLPNVVTDVGIGPHMSVRGLVTKIAGDKSRTRVAIVSHHESIEHGLRELNREPWIHMDELAQGELRILKVKRDTGKWNEHNRMLPSMLGHSDHY
jgi:phosphohistidine phosphatase SixA